MRTLCERLSGRVVCDQRRDRQVLPRYLRAIVTGGFDDNGGNQSEISGRTQIGPAAVKAHVGRMACPAGPPRDGGVSIEDVTTRYHRNGYDWDMHGSLFTPEKEIDGRR